MAVWRLGDQVFRASPLADTLEDRWYYLQTWCESLPDSFVRLHEFASTAVLQDRWATGLELVEAYEQQPTDDASAQKAIRALCSTLRDRTIDWATQNNLVPQPDPAELVLFRYLPGEDDEGEDDEGEVDEPLDSARLAE